MKLNPLATTSSDARETNKIVYQIHKCVKSDKIHNNDMYFHCLRSSNSCKMVWSVPPLALFIPYVETDFRFNVSIFTVTSARKTIYFSLTVYFSSTPVIIAFQMLYMPYALTSLPHIFSPISADLSHKNQDRTICTLPNAAHCTSIFYFVVSRVVFRFGRLFQFSRKRFRFYLWDVWCSLEWCDTFCQHSLKINRKLYADE